MLLNMRESVTNFDKGDIHVNSTSLTPSGTTGGIISKNHSPAGAILTSPSTTASDAFSVAGTVNSKLAGNASVPGGESYSESSTTVMDITTSFLTSKSSSNETIFELSSRDVDEFLQHKNDEFTQIVLPAIIFLSILFVVGVVGNLLVLYVYNRKLRKGTIRWFIQALAVFDLLSCLVAIPGEIVDMRINYTFGLSPMCKVLRTVSMFCTVSSGVTLIVVAVERYKRICTPLRRQISPKQAQIIVGLCTAIAVVCAAPASVIYGEQTTLTDDPRINGSDCSTADTFIDTIFPLAFSSFQFLLFIGGALVLIVLYSLIGRQIWSHARFRRGFNAAANRRMSYIFSGSECSSPTTDEVIFTYPYRRNGSGGEASSDSNNGNTDGGNVNNNNNNIDPQKDVTNGYAKNPATMTLTETNEANGSILSSKPLAPLTDTLTSERVSVKGGEDPIDEVQLRKKSYSKQTSSDKASTKVDGSSKPGDTLLRKKSFTKSLSGRERQRSGDSTLRGRYKRRASVHTQSDVRRFPNRSDSVSSSTRRTTYMLFFITVVYVVSFLPYLILMVIKVLDNDSLSGRGDAWELTNNILLRSYFINSMANPIIYSFCSRTFRKETSKLVHCRDCRK